MLSPKTLTSLGHWLIDSDPPEKGLRGMPHRCRSRTLEGLRGTGLRVTPGTEQWERHLITCVPCVHPLLCELPQANSKFQTDFPCHLQQLSDSSSRASWYFLKNVHKGEVQQPGKKHGDTT